MMKALNIFHISAECYPIAKVGGLADVVGALPKYQNLLGQKSSVVMPFYKRKFTEENEFDIVFTDNIQLDELNFPFQVLKEKNNSLGFSLYLIKIENLLDREQVYGYADADLQFIGFQTAILIWFRQLENLPDIIHCHDHHSGLIPFMMNYAEEFKSLRNIPTVGTIHNGEYQGVMNWDMVKFLPEYNSEHSGLLDWNGMINSLAALIKCCHAYTTVSEGYLEELLNYSSGNLDILYRHEKNKGFGIINGIDTDIWSPQTDTILPFNYKFTNLISRKKSNKQILCKRYNLQHKLPLISFIGRFAYEKGADLLYDIIDQTLAQKMGELNFFILGSGNVQIEQELSTLQKRFPENFALELGYNEPLSHLIYAASDFLLMPSRVEPCGLNQLYSMTYGTIPIVRKTGGLKDTVPDIENENGRGISFEETDTFSAVEAILRAINIDNEKTTSQKLRKKLMKIDFSWENSAKKYLDLYNSIIK